eukprot:6197842-Pleurochrysis_carterae.AAC.1
MGLGKTAQLLSALWWLSEHRGVEGPFLVVAPLSTLQARFVAGMSGGGEVATEGRWQVGARWGGQQSHKQCASAKRCARCGTDHLDFGDGESGGEHGLKCGGGRAAAVAGIMHFSVSITPNSPCASEQQIHFENRMKVNQVWHFEAASQIDYEASVLHMRKWPPHRSRSWRRQQRLPVRCAYLHLVRLSLHLWPPERTL